MTFSPLDPHDRKTQLYPAALAGAPLLVLGAGLLTAPQRLPGLVSLLAAGGLTYLVAQFVRDLGNHRQPAMWASWGGPPSSRMLRWSSTTNQVMQRHRHAAVQRATGISLPDQPAERVDPARADSVYETAVTALRNLARARQDPLIASELANYDFRRNLYGCRPIGVALAGLSLAGSVLLIVFGQRDVLAVPVGALSVAAALSLVWIVGWLALVTPGFVRPAAERYASALLDGAARLGAPTS